MDHQFQSTREGHLDSLALFQGPEVDTAVHCKQWIEYKPINLVTEGSALEFNVPASPSDYIDLKQSRLHVTAQVTKQDGSPVTKEDLVAPTNLTLQTLCS